MAALLGRLVAAQKADQAAARTVPLGCLARVLRAFGGNDDGRGAGRSAAAAVVPGLVEQLTARELEILVLLAAGTPNPAIAEGLVVSLDTLKSTSATCWASSGRLTAPRPSPGPASSA
jgi:LuxR family transcriptional regulator, maltose regulon positive regulatory protein